MSEPPSFSDDEQRLLRHEAFMAEVEKLRSPKGASHDEPLWLQALKSPVVSTLITVILGGILGNLIVSHYQATQKSNEQAVAEYRQYLQKEEEIVRHAYDVLGSGHFNAFSIVSLTRFWFQPENHPVEERPQIQQQRRQIIDDYTHFLALWEKEKEQVGFLLSYYHYGHPNVANAWRSTQESLDALLVCTNGHYKAYLESEAKKDAPEKVCHDEDAAYRTSLEELAAQINESRRYSWQQLGIPDRE